MKKLALLFALLTAPLFAQTNPYTTNFPNTENPISEGGVWLNGAKNGTSWGNMQTDSHGVHGVNTNSGCPSTPTDCNDSIAVLTGIWGANQKACGTVYINAGLNRAGTIYEIELQTNKTITAGNITGYEFNYSLFNNGNQYSQVVRWNGPLGQFTTIGGATGSAPPALANGDILCANHNTSGQLIMTRQPAGSSTVNTIFTVADTAQGGTVYTGGSPGVGSFNAGSTASDNLLWGFSSFTGSAATNSTVTAATCTATDVKNAFATVTSTTTLFVIPAGTCDWSTGVTLTAPAGSTVLTIQGQGNATGSDSLGNPTGYNDQTNITINSPTGNIVQFNGATTQTRLTVTGLSFNFTGSTSGCSVSWGGGSVATWPPPAFLRSTNNHWVTSLGGVCLSITFAGIFGVVDHNVVSMPTSNAGGQSVTNWWRVGANVSADGVAWGSSSWANPSTWGSLSALYFENNFVTGGYMNDCNNGGRQVFRYSTFAHSIEQGHEGVSDFMGCRTTEYYQNNTLCDAFNGAVSSTRSGTMMVWGNTTTTCTGQMIGLNEDRTNGHTFGNLPDWFYCGTGGVIPGPSTWDGNSLGPTNASGYPCNQQAGRGQGDVIQGSAFGFNQPMRANVTRKICPTASTTVNGQTVTCPAGYTIGTLSPPGSGSWARQALEPVYEWMDVRQADIGGDCNPLNCLPNRDYYQETRNQAAQSSPTSPFNGTTGNGHGTLANRPTTCTAGPGGSFGGGPPSIGGSPGVGYWATDTNTFYVCTATNTWTTYYTPLVHPHPFVSGSSGSPAVSLSPSTLSFGSVLIGQTSAVQQSTLTNTGTASLTISSITLAGTDPGDYIQQNTCVNAVAAGGSCMISVSFKPTTTGSRPATVSITDNASGSPHTITLSGTGVTATANFSPSPTSLTFSSQTVGTTSAPQTITITNSGSAALLITSIVSQGTNAGDFVPTPTGCASVAPSGGTCTVSVTFTPAATGARSSAIVFTDNASGSPQSVPVSGTGAGGTPGIGFSPTSLAFPNTAVTVTSSALSTTVTNTGGATLTFSSVSLTGTNAGDFAISANTCTGSIAINATCSVSVTFTPTATNQRTANISFADNAPGSPQTVPLTGVGTQAGTSFSPTSISFGSQTVNTTSAATSTTLTNTGTATLNITSIAITGVNATDYAISAKTCGTTLAASGTCTVSVTFTPSATGSRTASISFTDNAPNSPQTVPLSGTGTASASVSFTPSNISFGNQAVGTSSAASPVTMTNTGGVNITGITISITGTNASSFSQTNNCPASLAPAGTCTINAVFTPTAAGALSASISVADSIAGSPQTIPLSGTGGQGAVSLQPSQLLFGNQTVNTTSAPLSVTMKNIGTATFSISSFTFGSPNPTYFAISSNTCGASLAPNVSCVVSVTFTPGTTGSFTSNLIITDTAQGSPHTVFLSGTGTGTAGITFNPTSLTFPNTATSTSSAPLSTILSNPGTIPLTISSISITGTNAGDFSQNNNCGASVAPAGSCTINVTFTPTTTGSRSASVSVSDNASGSPHTVALAGMGFTPAPIVSLSTATITFGNQTVGTQSNPMVATLTNTGTASLTISSTSITGINSADFSSTTTCGGTLAVGASCSYSFKFTPSGPGSRTGTFNLTTNAATSPDHIALSGTGVASPGGAPSPQSFSD